MSIFDRGRCPIHDIEIIGHDSVRLSVSIPPSQLPYPILTQRQKMASFAAIAARMATIVAAVRNGYHAFLGYLPAKIKGAVEAPVTGALLAILDHHYKHFSLGFARLQSPIHHHKSYNLSEHAHWSIIIPPLLRAWLGPTHLQPLLLHKQKAVLGCSEDIKAVDNIVECFAAREGELNDCEG